MQANWTSFYLNPSSAGEFHRKEIGYGIKSVIENSLTLKAGDKIAHWKNTRAMLKTFNLQVNSDLIQQVAIYAASYVDLL